MGATVGRRQPRAAENIGMRLWHILRSRLRSMLFRDRRESDLSEELQLHLDREIERLQASGLSREEARLRARRLFGGVEQLKEECRDARGTGSWDALVRDTRQGLRRLVRDWRFTTAAVLILGLAIGANTAIFSVVNAVLFRKQAFADPDRLVNIYQNDRTGRPLVVTSYAAYKEIAEYPGIFAGTMAGSIPNPGRYLYEGAVRDAVVEFATATYLDVLGLRPSLGRWFDQSEEQPGAPLVAVVGYQAWTRLFRADPSLVGRVIKIEGRPVTIIGIGPANHRGTLDVGLGTDFWLPIPAVPSIFQNFAPRDAPTILRALVRESPSARRRHRAAGQSGDGRPWHDGSPPRTRKRFAREGEFSLGPGMTVVTSTDVRIHPQADKPFMAIASLVLVVVGLVLAIACSNLATLLLVRGADAREGSLGAAGDGRDAASAGPAPADREPAALAGGRHRRLHPGVVGHARAATDRPPIQTGSHAGLPRARLCDRACRWSRVWCSVWRRRSNPRGWTSCRRCETRVAADRSSAAHAEERARSSFRWQSRCCCSAARASSFNGGSGENAARRLCG